MPPWLAISRSLSTLYRAYTVSGVARTFGAHGQRTLRDPSPILHIPLTPPPHTPLLIQYLYRQIWFWTFSTSHKLNTWCILEIWVPLMTQWGPLDDAMINWDPLITWWEIRGHHFDDMMRKWGPLIAQWKIWGPLMTQWGNWKPLIKQWESSGAKWPDGKNKKLGPWWSNGTFGALWLCNGQIRDPSNGEIGAPWSPGGDIGGPKWRILFKRFNTTLLYSFKLMGPNWEISDVMQDENEYMGPRFPNVHLIFQRLCDGYQCLILFSFIYLDLWGYIGWRPPSGYLKSFVLSFLFFSSSYFFSFLFFLLSFSFSFFFFSFFSFLFFMFFFCLSLSGAPVAPGPLDIVHPCHPVATPLYTVSSNHWV